MGECFKLRNVPTLAIIFDIVDTKIIKAVGSSKVNSILEYMFSFFIVNIAASLRGPHKMSCPTSCGPCVGQPWSIICMIIVVKHTLLVYTRCVIY